MRRALLACMTLSIAGLAACGSSPSSQGGAPHEQPDAGDGGGHDSGTPGHDATASDTGGGGKHDASVPADTGGAGDGGASSAWVMGYFASWDDPSNGGFYAPSAIDWDGVSHVFAAFYVPDGNGGFQSGMFSD